MTPGGPLSKEEEIINIIIVILLRKTSNIDDSAHSL